MLEVRGGDDQGIAFNFKKKEDITMPRADGTGPKGKGAGTGRGKGGCGAGGSKRSGGNQGQGTSKGRKGRSVVKKGKQN